ncbi:MAG: tRNA (adenosine(37)-N6)-dimethylallyltransferase MiaA [Bacteroidales bacterium]|nr:tRNA (adenosine(37)-N6)-dimethylallyltransferase MiaA [Bacteroidales bacterium]
MKTKTLLVILGPTGVGKTELSLQIAEHFGSPIISADSRQIYRDIPICTAAATPAQQARVRHYFVGTHALDEKFSAAQFEIETMSLLERLFTELDTVVMTGGSMMYIDAVVKGIDDMPDVDPYIRASVREQYEISGLEPLLAQLRLLDPDYYARVDKRNTQRVIHGVEMCLSTGRPFSSFHTGARKERPFSIVQIGLQRERQELYGRIDKRVQQMLDDGLEAEARRVFPMRHLNSLNTVGMKEMFMYFEGQYTLEQAQERICHNTHIYSKKQMTWFKRDKEIHWFDPSQTNEILSFAGNM